MKCKINFYAVKITNLIKFNLVTLNDPFLSPGVPFSMALGLSDRIEYENVLLRQPADTEGKAAKRLRSK
ncbi:MAG TPA: hypothetical protein PK910_01340 [Bacteroidales bacterium]|nr:hypothetical protein [Bacteroidales bacterium]HRC88653.1 hypothetical protein [Bacteroidales bacterium]